METGLRKCLLVSAAVLSVAALAGCDGKKSPAKTNGEKSPKTGPVTKNGGKKSPTPKTPTVKLKPFQPPTSVMITADVTPKELQAKIAGYKGQVVLVDYWFVTCEPCKKAFPHTVALSRKHAKDGLVVVTMCVEEFEKRDKALEILKEKEAKLVNLFTSEKVDPDKIEEFGVVAFPTYRLYGPDGKLIQALEPKPTESAEAFQERVDVAVMEALGVKS